MPQVLLDRLATEREDLGDLGVGGRFGSKLDDAELARREALGPSPAASAAKCTEAVRHGRHPPEGASGQEQPLGAGSSGGTGGGYYFYYFYYFDYFDYYFDASPDGTTGSGINAAVVGAGRRQRARLAASAAVTAAPAPSS